MHCARPPAARSARAVTYHVRELDVGKAVDQGLAQAGELVEEGLVLLLDHLVLLLDGLQAALHGGDLKRTDAGTCNTSRPGGHAPAPPGRGLSS